MEDDRDVELDPMPADAPREGDEGQRCERPVDRVRRTVVGTVVAAGLLGLAEALDARPPRDGVVIVREAPAHPPQVPRRLELLLDPEHPERSMAFLPERTDARHR